jgi:magnesium chelatase family protein
MNNLKYCVYPCPCGFYGDSVKACTPFGPQARRGETACAPSTVTKYQKRISGPLLDRIDIHVEVPQVDY